MNAKQAKNIMIADYLHAMGINSKKVQGDDLWYCSPLREERTPSFKVNNRFNAWYDHGTGQGGNIIDLVMKMQQLSSVSEALQFLGGNMPAKQIVSFSFQQQNICSKITNIRVEPISNQALISYILSRKIDLELARLYCQEVNYTVRNMNYFSIGFKNDSQGYELSNQYFKGSSSPKDITTYKNEKDSCLIFEGFWDMLSYFTLKDINQPEHDVVVLNSVLNLPKAVSFIAAHDKVYTFLDNDLAGERTTNVLMGICKSLLNQSVHYSNFKDLNDYLCGKTKDPATSKEIREQPKKGNTHKL